MARQNYGVKGNNHFLNGVLVVAFYIAIFFLLNSFVFQMDETAIYFELGKNIILIIVYLFPVFLYFFAASRKKMIVKRGKDYNPAAELEQIYEQNENIIKEEWERQTAPGIKNRSARIPISLGQCAIIASVFLLFSIGGLVNTIKDINQGTETVILQQTRVLYEFDTETADYANVNLQGVNGDLLYELKVKQLNGTLIKLINTQHPYIAVTYYPNTETLVQLDVYAEDNVLTIPNGKTPKDENLSANTLEKLKEEAAKEPYEAVTLESIGLERYETLSYQSLDDVLADVAPPYSFDGTNFVTVIPTDDNFETYQLITDELKTNSDVNSHQECRVVFRDDVALVIVYNIRTNAVEDMYAVRCSYLQQNL